MQSSMAFGTRAIRIRLPGISVELSGLSDGQVAALVDDYGAFVVDQGVRHEEGLRVVCRVERLPESERPSSVPCQEENAPLPEITSTTSALGLEIRRSDFQARVAKRRSGWIDHLPVDATLGLATEDGLVRSDVIGIFLRILLAHVVLTRGGVLLHSSGMVYRDHAYLFTGRSGVGKTTLARKAASKGFGVLGDDVNVIIPEAGRLVARKVPGAGDFWRQRWDRSDPGATPLGGVVLLEQAPALRVRRILRPAEAVAGLISGCFVVNDNAEAFPLLMDVLTDLVAQVPMVRVGVALEDSFEDVMHAVVERIAE